MSGRLLFYFPSDPKLRPTAFFFPSVLDLSSLSVEMIAIPSSADTTAASFSKVFEYAPVPFYDRVPLFLRSCSLLFFPSVTIRLLELLPISMGRAEPGSPPRTARSPFFSLFGGYKGFFFLALG